MMDRYTTGLDEWRYLTIRSDYLTMNKTSLVDESLRYGARDGLSTTQYVNSIFWANDFTGPTLKAESRVGHFNDKFVSFIFRFLTNKDIRGTRPNTLEAAGAKLMGNYDNRRHF